MDGRMSWNYNKNQIDFYQFAPYSRNVLIPLQKRESSSVLGTSTNSTLSFRATAREYQNSLTTPNLDRGSSGCTNKLWSLISDLIACQKPMHTKAKSFVPWRRGQVLSFSVKVKCIWTFTRLLLWGIIWTAVQRLSENWHKVSPPLSPTLNSFHQTSAEC